MIVPAQCLARRCNIGEVIIQPLDTLVASSAEWLHEVCSMDWQDVHGALRYLTAVVIHHKSYYTNPACRFWWAVITIAQP